MPIAYISLERKRRILEPNRNKCLCDVGVQLVQGLVAGRELRGRADQQGVPEVLVVDQQVIVADGDRALADPMVLRNRKFIRKSAADRVVVECGQLAVARLEVLVIDARKDVAVEVGGVLGIETETAVENEAAPGL